MPEQVLDVFEGEALREQERRGGMTEVVEAERGSPARIRAAWRARVTDAAWSGVPMVVVNT